MDGDTKTVYKDMSILFLHVLYRRLTLAFSCEGSGGLQAFRSLVRACRHAKSFANFVDTRVIIMKIRPFLSFSFTSQCRSVHIFAAQEATMMLAEVIVAHTHSCV